jgi:hypothetical protein
VTPPLLITSLTVAPPEGEQVEMGVAVRMAVLHVLARGPRRIA